MQSHRHGARVRGGLGLVVVLVLIAACGQHLPGRATAAPTLGPRPSQGAITAFDTTFTGELPRSVVFAGLRFTVESVQVSNTHPYPILNDDPGPNVFWTLNVTVENVSGADVAYGFDETAFSLRTWSGELLDEVRHPGSRRFGRQPGETGTDTIAFGKAGFDTSEALAFIDGAQLLIGRAPDARASLPLSGAFSAADLATTLAPANVAPVHVGAIDWAVSGGLTSLDRPAGTPQTASGERADEGQRFVEIMVRGTVSGSRYGQATVASDVIRLVVDGVELEALQFRGEANVKEGASTSFTLSFLAPAPWDTMLLRVTDADGPTGTIELIETGVAT